MENVKEVIDIFQQLQNTPSRLDKERIIQTHSKNTLFKDILYFVYNPYIITGIASKSLNKFKTPMSGIKFEGIYQLLDYIKTHHNGSDEDIKAVMQYIYSQPKEQQIFLKEIITKSLKCGVTAVTINKIFPNFIPQFSIMLAHKYMDNIKRVMGKTFILTTKLDGIRCVIIKDYNGDITIFNRQGRAIEGLNDITNEAQALPNGFVYDGELLLRNDKKLASKDLYRATVSIVNSDIQDKKNLQFNCFDMVDIDEFKKGKGTVKCVDRKNQIHELFEKLNLNWIIEVSVLYVGKDINKVEEYLNKAIANDEEGIMLNTSEGKYECKRSYNILKVKKFNDADVRVLNVLEGTGSNKDKLGAITIQFEYKNKLYECNCGSGFSQEERELYWKQPELILDKIVTIGYFEITENKKNGVGLRFPTWKSIIRTDKTEISMN